jgi:hypothetical protein
MLYSVRPSVVSKDSVMFEVGGIICYWTCSLIVGVESMLFVFD